MNTLKRTLLVLTVSLALTVTTFAGDTNGGPGVTPTPPPPPPPAGSPSSEPATGYLDEDGNLILTLTQIIFTTIL